MAKRLFSKDGRVRPILRVFLYCVLLIVGIPLVSVLIGLGGMALGHPRPDPNDEKAASVYFTLSAPIVTVGVAFLLRRFLDRRSIASLGLSLRGRWWLLLGAGLILGILSQVPHLLWALHQG